MNKLLAMLLLFYGTVLCQERKTLPGKIVIGSTGIPNVFVINKNTGAEVKTGSSGNFAIDAKAGDRLAVYSDKVEVRDFAVSEKSFSEVPYIMEVTSKVLELEEVVINSQTVTSQSLGLVPKGYVFETPAERSIRFHGTMPSGLDYLFTALGGGLYLKKLEVKYAEKNALLAKMGGVYTEEEIISKCKIPKEYVDGFLYYAVENAALSTALKNKDTGGAKLILSELSVKYLEIIHNE